MSVVHTHSDGALHSDCGLCTTAHSTVHVTEAPVVFTVTPTFEFVVVLVPQIRPRLVPRSSLFTRPPPNDPHIL